VTLLRTGGDLVYISDGLDNGDRVSLTTLDSSFDSSEVVIQSTTPTDKLDQNGRARVKPGDTQISRVTAAEATSTDDSEGG
jgi:hypothetical protein